MRELYNKSIRETEKVCVSVSVEEMGGSESKEEEVEYNMLLSQVKEWDNEVDAS